MGIFGRLWADALAFSLTELRRQRELVEIELSRRLGLARERPLAPWTADGELLSTLRTPVKGMGGRLEVVALFGNERIALDPR